MFTTSNSWSARQLHPYAKRRHRSWNSIRQSYQPESVGCGRRADGTLHPKCDVGGAHQSSSYAVGSAVTVSRLHQLCGVQSVRSAKHSVIGLRRSCCDRYHPLVSSSTIKSANNSFTRSGGCRDQIQSCYTTGSTSTCSRAQSFCNNDILSPLAGNYDVYFILAKNPDPYPADLSTYLGSSSLKSKIGAESDWEETSDEVYDNFANTGDWMTNSRPHLENVITSGVRTIIYVGDAVRNSVLMS